MEPGDVHRLLKERCIPVQIVPWIRPGSFDHGDTLLIELFFTLDTTTKQYNLGNIRKSLL